MMKSMHVHPRRSVAVVITIMGMFWLLGLSCPPQEGGMLPGDMTPGEMTPPDVPPIVLTEITISPNAITLTAIGQTQQLTVSGKFSDDSTKNITLATEGTTYNSNNTSVATVTADGLVTAVAMGKATITVANAGISSTVFFKPQLPMEPPDLSTP